MKRFIAAPLLLAVSAPVYAQQEQLRPTCRSAELTARGIYASRHTNNDYAEATGPLTWVNLERAWSSFYLRIADDAFSEAFDPAERRELDARSVRFGEKWSSRCRSAFPNDTSSRP